MTADRTTTNASQLQDDIDSGRTGDKVAGFDPSAAPLGTDDEAAGTPPSAEAVAVARRQECAQGGGSAAPNAAEPELQPNAARSPGPRLTPALVGAAAGVLLVVGAVLLLI
jgi:hypothetical protein